MKQLVGVPTGFAPAPADVASYVRLSNGSVPVQLANQHLAGHLNNFFIDGSGVLYLSLTVSAGISGGNVASGTMTGSASAHGPASANHVRTNRHDQHRFDLFGRYL